MISLGVVVAGYICARCRLCILLASTNLLATLASMSIVCILRSSTIQYYIYIYIYNAYSVLLLESYLLVLCILVLLASMHSGSIQTST